MYLVPTLCVGTHDRDALRRSLRETAIGRSVAAERRSILFPRRAWEQGNSQ